MKSRTAALAALALTACTPGAGNFIDADNAATATDAVALKATIALSLGELAYNSGEAAATAAIESGRLSKEQSAALGDAVHDARAYRDQARVLVAAGGDASAAIESLDAALTDIHTRTGR